MCGLGSQSMAARLVPPQVRKLGTETEDRLEAQAKTIGSVESELSRLQDETQVSCGLQLQSLWRIPTTAVG